MTRFRSAPRTFVLSLAIAGALLAGNIGRANAADAAPGALAWTFAASPPSADQRWTAEVGTMTLVDGAARLQPTPNRRVVLLSPPGLPTSAAKVEQFVIGTEGTGLQRVRIQGRRDARGGWITIADASGPALRGTTEGYVVKRNPGARDVPIERLRIELQFATTNPRLLQRIEAR